MSLMSKFSQATRRGYKSMIQARERQAQRYVYGALLDLDDETLASAGYDRRELRKKMPIRIIF